MERCCWVMFVIAVGRETEGPEPVVDTEESVDSECVGEGGVAVVVTREGGRTTCGVVGAGPFRVAMNVSAPFLRVFGIDVMLFQMETARSLVLVKDCFVLLRIVSVKDTQPSDIPLEAPKSESPTEAVVARPRSLVEESTFVV